MATIPDEADFYRFMEKHGPNNDASKRNYLSWLRFVSDNYNPKFESLTKEDVNRIFKDLRNTKANRDVYKSDSSISDIKSALNKYIEYLSKVKLEPLVIADISSILGEMDTTIKTQIEARLGHGKYRREVIDVWRRCAVTEFDRVDLLIASHIKPWKLSSSVERLDRYNGLLLSPNLDKLFDRGYISFEDNGEIIVSPLLSCDDLNRVGISANMGLYKVEQGCIPYLEFHRNEILVQKI